MPVYTVINKLHYQQSGNFSNKFTYTQYQYNNHHLPRPNANLFCSQKSTFHVGINIFNSLPPSVTILKNDKAEFKAALRKHQHSCSFYSVDEIFMCKYDL
jgi:hypothetical protein